MFNSLLNRKLLIIFFVLLTERTEKIPMGSIKNVVSEPIEDHDEYHMMVRESPCEWVLKALLKRLPRSFFFYLALLCERDGAISPSSWNILKERFD